MNTHPQSEKAALYALGFLSAEEAAEFETQLAGDPSLAEETRSYTETAAELAFATAAEPPPSLRDRVMNKALSGSEHGMHIVRSSEGRWSQTRFRGVTAKLLLKDHTTGNWTWLLKMDPGAEYPSHRHSSYEQCLVLEGDIGFGDLRLTAGDFEAAPPGTRHEVLRTEGGCLLLIIASPGDEILA